MHMANLIPVYLACETSVALPPRTAGGFIDPGNAEVIALRFHRLTNTRGHRSVAMAVDCPEQPAGTPCQGSEFKQGLASELSDG